MIFPQINLNINDVINQSIQENSSTIPKEYAWDFENNDFLLCDGKFTIVEGLEALKIYIWKALHTIKARYSIYSDTYGHDLDSVVGQGFSKEFLEIETKKLVWECLSKNPHILRLENFAIDLSKDILSISFTVITDLGEVSMIV